ncbi:MAG: SPOR domain-containing protein [Nitrospirae bacterium]|nr:SPOR domain-containing protein [Nitrospirota bacterium]
MDGDNILVIDDDRNNTEQISEILRAEGYTVYSAKTKVEALETALQIHPVVVLVKSMLIDASGYEVIRDLRNEESLKHLPFIMLSEIEKKYDDRYRTIYKIVDTVKLPVEKNDLLQKIRTHIEWSVPDEEQPEQGEDYALEDEKHEDIKFGLTEKTDDPSGVSTHGSPDAFRSDADPTVGFSYENTIKINDHESPNQTGNKYSDTDFSDHEDDSMGEDTTAIDSDEDDILKAINESRAKRKKLFVITAIAALAIVLGAGYLLFFNDTKPEPNLIAQKTTQTPVKKIVTPMPQPTPQKSTVAALPTPVATAVKPVAATPKPEATPVTVASTLPTPSSTPTHTPTPTPSATPAYTPTPTPVHTPEPQVKKSEPAESKPALTQQETKQPVAKPVEKTVVQPDEKPVATVAKNTSPAEPAPKVKAARNKNLRNQVKTPIAKRRATTQESGLYVIQLGSFRDVANAKRLTDSLRKDGYAASILTVTDPKGNSSHKVLAGKYKNKADAMATMKKLKDTKKMDVILRKS